MKIEGAIFDLDGTLLDSMFIWDKIGEDYLKSLGIKPKENLNDTFKTMSLMQSAAYYRSEYGVALSIEQIISGVNRMIEHFYTEKVTAKAGVKAMLETFKGKGVKMCVATATDSHLAEAALRRNGVIDCFSGIFTCTQVGSGKDTPDIFNKALTHLGTHKQSTVVFEDALYAVQTAKKAGFFVAGVYDKSEAAHSAQIRKLSDVFFNSFEEMRGFFD